MYIKALETPGKDEAKELHSKAGAPQCNISKRLL